MRRLIVAGKTGASKAKWVDAWKSASQADAAVLVNVAALGEVLNVAGASPAGQPLGQQSAMAAKLGAFAPLWQGATLGVLTAHFNTSLKLRLLMKAKSRDDAQKIKATLEAAVTLGQNSL